MALIDHIGPAHNSHFKSFRRCKKQYHYSYIENIQKKRPSLPLVRGIWLHYCLQAQFLKWGIEDGTLLEIPESIDIDDVGEVEIRFAEDKTPGLIVSHTEGLTSYPLSAAGMLNLLEEQVWSRLFTAEKDKYIEDGHTLPQATRRILEEYFYFYRDSFKNRNFRVLLVEVEWQREYEDEAFEGRIDYIIQDIDTDLIVCGDWKSTKREPSAEYKFMESQLNLYPWGVAPKLIEHGLPKKQVDNMAVEFDYLSTKLPTKPRQNQNGELSKAKINTTYLTFSRAIQEYGLKWSKEDIYAFLAKNEKEFFVRKRLPRNKKVVSTLIEENYSDLKMMELVHEGKVAPSRTKTQDCVWDCDFLPICKGELYGQDVRHIRNSEYETRRNTKGEVETDA